ncbi:MAG: HDOD domain-containing protein [bacterium]
MEIQPQVADVEELSRDLQQISELPTLPEAADYHRAMVQRNGCSMREIKRAILLDPPLATTILREAGHQRPSGTPAPMTIEDALVLIPEETIRSLCARQPKLRTFAPWNELNLRTGVLWRHAVGTGILAKALHLRKRMRHIAGPDPYLAGLLHHIGWFALDSLRPQLVRKAIRSYHESGRWSLEQERDLFGFDHAAIGALLLESWGLHPDLVDVVRYHHQPSLTNRLSSYAALIQVASTISPDPFPLEIPLDQVESSLPNHLRFREGPHLLDEMRSRYGRYIRQAMNGSKMMLSWL